MLFIVVLEVNVGEMSGSFRRRHSKWDHQDTEALTEDFHDNAHTRRPREPLSPPSRSSQRRDSRSKERILGRDKEGNNARTFTGPGDSRQRHSRSPKNGWARMHSRSRSRSPSNYLRREPDRSRTKSGVSAIICREIVAGRCRKGNNCHFLHEDVQPYESRQPLDSSQPDDWDSRHRTTGGSRYSSVEDKDYPPRSEKSMNKYEHRDLSGDVFMDEGIDDVPRDRDRGTFPKNRDPYSHRNQNHEGEPGDVFEKGPVDDFHHDRDRDRRSRDTYSSRNHDREPVEVFEKRPINPQRSRDTYSHRSHDREPADMLEKKRRVDDVHRDRSRDTYNNHRNHDHESAELFEKRPVGDVLRDRENPHRSRDTYQNHDREPSNVFEKAPVDDTYRDRDRDNDHRGRDGYRNHDREPHKRAEPLCKFFASGNCKNVTRCRFVHEVQERQSPARRSQDDKWGRDHKVENNQAWDGPTWDDIAKVSNTGPLRGWGGEKNETVEAKPQDNCRSHDIINVNETWATPASNDGFQQDEKPQPPLQWGSGNNVEIVSGGNMEISPRNDTNTLHPLSSSNSVAPSLSNVSFETARPDMQYPIGFQEQKVYNEPLPLPMHNPSHKAEKPDVYHEENRNTISNPIGTVNVPPQQDFFQIDQTAPQQSFFQNDQTAPQLSFLQTSGVQSISGFTPTIQSQPQFPSDVSGMDGIQLSLNPTSYHSSVATDAPSANTAGLSAVSNEQLAQLSNLSASLAQLIENRQQLAPASIPPVMDPTTQTLPNPETSERQYDPLLDSVEQKTEKKGPDEESGDIKKVEHVVVPKDDEKVKPIAEDGHVDEGDDGNNKSKDVKAIRPFKFALAEFVKELLKPSWKDGHVSKDAYKAIVKKVVDKIIETQGLQVPQTKEKIDHYLSCSKPKIDKLVQAYVGKFQKT